MTYLQNVFLEIVFRTPPSIAVKFFSLRVSSVCDELLVNSTYDVRLRSLVVQTPLIRL